MNPFEALADVQQNGASKARDRAAERRLAKLVVKSEADAPMVASPSEKAAYERSRQLRHYNKMLTQRRLDLLNGPQGVQIKGLLQLMDTLSPSSAPALMSFLAGCNWFLGCDRGTRQDILSLISIGIARHRVRNGLPPFDDSLIGEPPTAFEIIRSNFQVLS
jgi:hypothetical protein